LSKKYDHIIVGGGISGLTLALILSLNGKKILLLEKATRIGGSLSRFFREGVPFDTGFHFTGGFSTGGVLMEMLKVLGFTASVKPVFLTGPGSSVFAFDQDNNVYDMPSGTDNFRLALHKNFPGEKNAIDRYFDLIKKVWQSTSSLRLRNINSSVEPLEEDFITLQSVLDSLTNNVKLKGILCVFCLCYGTKPEEVSFANHARVAGGLYESVARIENGGEALVNAFKDAFKKADVEIRCNSFITECADIEGNQVKGFILNNSERVAGEGCTFTIHPQEVLKVLPKEYLKKAFLERVSSFETTSGFFCTFGVVDNADPSDFGPSIVSLLPSYNLNELLDSSYKGRGALAIIRSVEAKGGKRYCVINAFEPEFFSQINKWGDSSTGKRPADYYKYKKDKMDEIKKRICGFYPQYCNNFRMLDAASVLTFRDYLFSPEGNAYGIKQKVGQFNLFGRQSLTNIYVAGQSAILPGLVGAMLSSFILARLLIGKKDYGNFMEMRLCS